MNRFWLPLISLFLASCHPGKKITWPERSSMLRGTDFYRQAAAMNWKQRDSFALKEFFSGNVPVFLKKFVPVSTGITDSSSGERIRATFYVSPDYYCVGTQDDWARVPLTPMAAQRLADKLGCFLPTRKMVDAIYARARIKLEPVPLFAFRDSTVTMWHHHLIIEGQRRGRKGLIAGIKKDVVISGRVSRETRADREAIYGWHKPGGNPIQPLYTGHVNWWVDYSHGIRLVYRQIRVSRPGKQGGTRWMDYEEVMKDPLLQKLLCDEPWCDFLRYAY